MTCTAADASPPRDLYSRGRFAPKGPVQPRTPTCTAADAFEVSETSKPLFRLGFSSRARARPPLDPPSGSGSRQHGSRRAALLVWGRLRPIRAPDATAWMVCAGAHTPACAFSTRRSADPGAGLPRLLRPWRSLSRQSFGPRSPRPGSGTLASAFPWGARADQASFTPVVAAA